MCNGTMNDCGTILHAIVTKIKEQGTLFKMNTETVISVKGNLRKGL